MLCSFPWWRNLGNGNTGDFKEEPVFARDARAMLVMLTWFEVALSLISPT